MSEYYNNFGWFKYFFFGCFMTFLFFIFLFNTINQFTVQVMPRTEGFWYTCTTSGRLRIFFKFSISWTDITCLFARFLSVASRDSASRHEMAGNSCNLKISPQCYFLFLFDPVYSLYLIQFTVHFINTFNTIKQFSKRIATFAFLGSTVHSWIKVVLKN